MAIPCALNPMGRITKVPLNIKAVGGTLGVTLERNVNPGAVSLSYKVGDGVWSSYTIGNTISLSEGQFVYFKNNGTTFNDSNGFYYFRFNGSGFAECYGDIKSLINYSSYTQYCFRSLFWRARILRKAPDLMETKLAKGCYYNMFQECYNLNSINVNFTEWGSDNETFHWFKFTSSSGTFTKPSALPETRGESYIPSGWTIVNK